MGSKTGLGQHLHTMLLYSIFQGLAIFPLTTLAAATSPKKSHYGTSSDSHVHLAFSNFVVHGHQKRASGECTGFQGDQDTYGLGIRIGLYFQWVTSSIAYNLVPSEAINMRGVNNCFQLAMFAGLLYVTITNGWKQQLHPMEAYLLLLFCMGGVCSGTTEVDDELDDQRPMIGVAARKSYAYLEASSLGGYVRVLLGCGFIGYGLWFLFLGMDDMHNAFPNDCNYAFFLTRVDLFGWFRTFLKVLFVCATIPAVLSLVFMTMSLVNATRWFLLDGGWQGRVKPHTQSASSSEGEVAEDEKPGLQNIKLRKQNVGFSGALLLFILSVELIIRWNKIQGVGAIGSTGQLLPVIIGVGGVGRVIIRLTRDFLEELALARRNKNGSNKVKADHFMGSMTNNLAPTQPTLCTGNELDSLSQNPVFVHDTGGLDFASN
ncbi:hypothetical protein L211DRAFT_686771 [Terfezia boudieri ATCC MYA-4762]|uniref:Uncharacterized protein n=1 Tax=Terfezia boudieri ATCC MYA-4762 TaxID=1051890 RepID=A0A3N4L7G3_9PEZI|nr:hypothetical protein L211DRAFT_686771 [Terfezia boudieri ATCC MYA-4762]